MTYGRDEREEIGNQGEENVKALLAHHFGDKSVQTTDGQGGHPDVYLSTDSGRMVIEVKTMMPFSFSKKDGKRVRRVGYTHFNRTSWILLNEFARGRIASVAAIIEVRFARHPHIYFVLKRQDIEDWNQKVKVGAEWMDIPLWYIFERGIGFGMDIPPEFDWTPLETAQVQIGDETNE